MKTFKEWLAEQEEIQEKKNHSKKLSKKVRKLLSHIIL